MKDYYGEETSGREDGFWSDSSTELEFPWDDIPDEPESTREKKKIHVVLVEPGKLAREADIGTELSDLQRAVGGGFIETFYPFDEACVIVLDDDGKLNGSLPNRAIYDEKGHVEDIIFGPFFICDGSTEEFGSLSEEQVERYKKKFEKPEHFYMIDGEIFASQYTPHAGRGER